MHKIIKIILIVFALLILTSCVPSTPEIDYRVGTDGLELTINGPDEILLYGNQESAIEEYEFKIDNLGAYSVKSNEIYMRIKVADGLLKEKTSNKDELILRGLGDFSGAFGLGEIYGKTRYHKEGDSISHYLSYKTNVGKGQSVSSSIKADLCYLYNTVLSDSICIDTKRRRDKMGCQEKEYDYSSGQGAPLQISSVEVREETDAEGLVTLIRLLVTVDNINGDTVTKGSGTSFMQGCLLQDGLNIVEISAKLGTESLDCNEENATFELKDDQAIVECKLIRVPMNSEGFFYSPLYINLTYGYHASAVKDVEIIREEN